MPSQRPAVGAETDPLRRGLERAEEHARELATEHAALRQVATLVARESSPEQLFAVVAEQVARVLKVPHVRLVRYEPDASVVVGGFSEGDHEPFPMGSRWPVDSPGVTTTVRQTGRLARVEDYADVPGEAAAVVRGAGIRSAIASPIVVEKRLWGAMVVLTPRREPFPEDTEARLTDFTELVAAAIANAESREAQAMLAKEQAALWRVATLVAEAAPPAEIFSAVTNEVSRLFRTGLVVVGKFDGDPAELVIVGVGGGTDEPVVGSRWKLDDALASTAVYRTGLPARLDHPRGGADPDVVEILERLRPVATVAVPIKVEGRLWGSMITSTLSEPLPLDTDERLQRFTDLIATALANAEARAEVERLVEEQAALRRVATLVAQEAPQADVFGAIAEEIGELIGTQEVRMLRFDSDGSAVVVGSLGRPDAFPLGSRQQLDGDSVASRVLRTGRPARLDDYRAAAGPLPEAARSIGIRAVVGVPVFVERRLWGVISAGSTHAGALPADAEARLDEFTKLMATAIANAEARGEVHRLADEQAALRRVAVLVAQQPSPSEVFTAVTETVGLLLDADLAVLHVFPGDGTATTVATWGGDGPLLPVGTRFPLDGDNLAARIFETGVPARMHSHEEAWERAATVLAQSLRVRSAVAAPILVEGKLWGALMAATRRGEPWAENAETRIAQFTELVATAVANAESREARSRLIEEQAALRRVATLAAQGASPQDLFDAVAEEVGRLLLAANVSIGRYEPDDSITSMASWSFAGHVFTPGVRWPIKGTNVAWLVLQTGRSARIDDFSAATDAIGVAVREAGYASAVGSPIIVEGHLWGAISAASSEGPMPPGTEARLEEFTELVGTAIANADSRQAVAELADEQAALRRVATLVAQGVKPSDLFTAVSDEVGRLFDANAAVVRFESEGPAIVFVGIGGRLEGALATIPIGTRRGLEDSMATTEVYRTGRSGRVDAQSSRAAAPAATAERLGETSTVASPIIVEGRLWGAVAVSKTNRPGEPTDERLPLGVEARLEKFTELVGTAIANAESRSELAASRRRIVAASDEARRRFERDLHDSTQQRLISLMIVARSAEANVPPEMDDLREELSRIAAGMTDAVEELQVISRGIHPAILSQGGLAPALRALARRSALPVELDVETETRLSEPIEVATYFVVSEALTNATKHSNAAHAEVSLACRNGTLVVSIRDDGVGGATFGRGSGLLGLQDRVEALGGTIRIESEPGIGTSLVAMLPLIPGDQLT